MRFFERAHGAAEFKNSRTTGDEWCRSKSDDVDNDEYEHEHERRYRGVRSRECCRGSGAVAGTTLSSLGVGWSGLLLSCRSFALSRILFDLVLLGLTVWRLTRAPCRIEQDRDAVSVRESQRLVRVGLSVVGARTGADHLPGSGYSYKRSLKASGAGSLCFSLFLSVSLRTSPYLTLPPR